MSLPGPVVRLLDTLNPLQRSAWGVILSGATAGLSGTSVLGALRSAGIGFRTETFFSVFNEARLQAGQAEYFASLSSDQPFNPQRLPRAPWGVRGTYSVGVSASALDLSTGEIRTLHPTLSYDEPVSRAQIESDTFSLLNDCFTMVEEITVERAYRR